MEKWQLAQDVCLSALFKVAVMLQGSPAVLQAVLQWGKELKGEGISHLSVKQLGPSGR